MPNYSAYSRIGIGEYSTGPVSGQSCYRLSQDRWHAEQVPQAGKQLLGAGRQFVSGKESCQRLPELALFAGAALMYEAASQPALATGF